MCRLKGSEPPGVVRCDAFPGTTFPAKGGWLNQQTELLTGDVPVKLRVLNPDGLLRVGMSVRVELSEPGAEGLAVPVEAVFLNEEGHHVVTVVTGGKAVSTEVELSSDAEPEVRADGQVRVLKGLSEGDEVAVFKSAYALPKDTPVKVEDGPPESEKH